MQYVVRKRLDAAQNYDNILILLGHLLNSNRQRGQKQQFEEAALFNFLIQINILHPESFDSSDSAA